MTRRPARRLVAIALALGVALGCSTRGEAPGFPKLPFGGAAPSPDPVYTGSAAEVYRTCFDAVIAEFSTSPRIVKPERGLLVFSDDASGANTSIVVTTVGENAAAVHIESRGEGGVLRGRTAAGIHARLVEALDARLERAEEIAPIVGAPRGTSALAEKQDALERIRRGLGFEVVPGYLVDLEAQDLRQLAAAIDRRIGVRDLTVTERRRSMELALDLGKELHDLGRYEEAKGALEHAVALDPESAVAQCNLGELCKHLRDFDACLRHLNEAERLDPLYPETYINRGIVYDDYVVDPQKALENYRKYLELGGTDPRVADWIRALEADS